MLEMWCCRMEVLITALQIAAREKLLWKLTRVSCRIFVKIGRVFFTAKVWMRKELCIGYVMGKVAVTQWVVAEWVISYLKDWWLDP